MSPGDRVVTAMPVQTLWNDDGELSATRGRWLTREAIREFLALGPVRFVVANVGHRLRWIPIADRFEFWKVEVAPHLSDGGSVFRDGRSGPMTYVASEWLVGEHEPPIVLLEAHH